MHHEMLIIFLLNLGSNSNVTSPTAENGGSSRQTSPPFSPTSRIPKLNSGGSFSSSGGGVTSPNNGRTPAKTYYYGESPASSHLLANGVVGEIYNARRMAAGGGGSRSGSMEKMAATPHTGEVLRIRVGSERGDRGPSIHREDKEISPRFQDHKVTIKVSFSD